MLGEEKKMIRISHKAKAKDKNGARHNYKIYNNHTKTEGQCKQ